MKRVLVGSPVRQKHTILKEFLLSLEEVDADGIEYDYYFVDDNDDKESTKLLKDFSKKHNVVLKVGKEIYKGDDENYLCNDDKHHWKTSLIKKIIFYKDSIIEYARENNYDYLFFIDSDIVLSKPTIKHLMSRNVDIVSNIFWTQFFVGQNLEPQIWLQDGFDRYTANWDKPLSEREKFQTTFDFVTQMRYPDIYEVGGLGACTLISKKALKAGVSFKLIDNVSFWGEDRHFCIRAEVLGFKLYVDTVYPAYHIYREKYLDRVDEFKRDGFKFDMCQEAGGKSKESRVKTLVRKVLQKGKLWLKNKLISKFDRKRVVGNDRIVLSMVVHNEEGRYLEDVLKQASKIVDAAVIIDDASSDKTVQICEECLKDVPHKIIKLEKSLFSREYKLRRLQWRETIAMNPGWILNLDADEIFEEDAKEKIDCFIHVDNVDVYNFRLFDMWNETEYRDDEWWHAHNSHMNFLIRYQPKFKYKFKKTNQHCGRFPKNLNMLRQANVEIKIKHMGWVREADRKAKYERYMKLDRGGKVGFIEQYESILDKNPRLRKFEDYGKK